MRKNWEAAIGPYVVNPQPGDILQKAGDKRGLARGVLKGREWKFGGGERATGVNKRVYVREE
jgi:hypothetical protein